MNPPNSKSYSGDRRYRATPPGRCRSSPPHSLANPLTDYLPTCYPQCQQASTLADVAQLVIIFGNGQDMHLAVIRVHAHAHVSASTPATLIIQSDLWKVNSSEQFLLMATVADVYSYPRLQRGSLPRGCEDQQQWYITGPARRGQQICQRPLSPSRPVGVAVSVGAVCGGLC